MSFELCSNLMSVFFLPKQETSSGESGEDSSSEEETNMDSGNDFASQFGEGFAIDSDSDDGSFIEQSGSEGSFDDGFALDGVGDDVIPVYDIETLDELKEAPATENEAEEKDGDGNGWGAKVSKSADEARSGATMRAGALKKTNPLEELRAGNRNLTSHKKKKKKVRF